MERRKGMNHVFKTKQKDCAKLIKKSIFRVLVFGCILVILFIPIKVNAATSSRSMHRLYNPNSGEHFYTANSNEKNHLTKVGWKYEGIGWDAPASGNAVYRLYNKNAGDHHYTLNVNEKNHLVKVGWKYEGVGWYSDTKKAVPLYRAYNPNAKAGSHNYTVNYGEQQNLLKHGWRNEGIAWYGVKRSTSVTKYTVTIKHVGTDGKVLKTSTTSVEKGKKYTAKSGSFSGYTLNGSSTQIVTVDGNKTITFKYTKNPISVTKYNVTVVHKGSDGKTLETEKAVQVEKGKTYTAKAKSFSGYTLSGSTTQTITVNGNKTITFNYTKNTTPAIKYNVTVIHQDSDGKILLGEYAYVEKGTIYTAKAESFSGYTLNGSSSQTVTVDGDKRITFNYTKNSTPVTKYNVTVVHKGSDGKTLETEKAVQVEKGKTYTAKAKSYSGYTLAGSTTQTVTVDGNKTITFNYKKNSDPVITYDVTVLHKSTDGKLLDSQLGSAEKGKIITFEARSFEGYTLSGPSKQTVTIDEEKTIVFYYVKNSESIAKAKEAALAKLDGMNLKDKLSEFKSKVNAATSTSSIDQIVKDAQQVSDENDQKDADAKALAEAKETAKATIKGFGLDYEASYLARVDSAKTIDEVNAIMKEAEANKPKTIDEMKKEMRQYVTDNFTDQYRKLKYQMEAASIKTKEDYEAFKEKIERIVAADKLSESEQVKYVNDRLTEMVNEYRKENGSVEMANNDVLQHAADIRAKELAELFDHDRPDGSGYQTALWQAERETGQKLPTSNGHGENIAETGYTGMNAEEAILSAFDAWQKSAGHDKNMLNNSFKYVAFSAFKVGNDWYVVTLFLSAK